MGETGRMHGKRVIVTGSGTGIGREIALECSRQGADVAFHYCHSAAGVDQALEAVKGWGGKAEAFKADFSQIGEVTRFADEAIAYLGGVDCLINNSGITFNKPFLKITPEQFDKIYHVNIRAQFFLMQRAVASMIERGGGAIVNLTSIHGVMGAPEHSVYAGTKGAIIATTRALAMELGHKGIRVNAIAPGCVPVENYTHAIPDFDEAAMREEVKDAIPLGRAGYPIDIAKVAVFLCSEDASFILGQTIVVDGGTTSLMSLFKDFRNETNLTFGAGYV